MKKDNYYIKDDPRLNSLFGYDYSFCNSNCKHYECGRNRQSKSMQGMLKYISLFNGVYCSSDFSHECCNYWKKRKGE
nr:MAG TPA: hypothetical protein [Caudoviricetes sp.]